MKLFYFLDFVHVKNYGAPVTYDRYVKLEHGPIPSTIKSLVDDAGEDIDHSILADVIDIRQPDDIRMYNVLPRRKLKDSEIKMFSETELEILQKVCEKFGSKNTAFVEDVSHNEAPWKETELLDDIPYTLAAKDDDCFVSEEEIAMALELA